jgi:DNA-binding response OmpR family regulator
MERLLPLRSGRASDDTAPPLNDLRPFLLVLPSKGRSLDLQLALQETGVPCVLALDEKMVEYWRRTENPRVIVIEVGLPWAKGTAATLIRQGRSVVALSDDEEERIRAVGLGFDDAFPLTFSARETVTKLRKRYLIREQIPAEVPAIDGPLKMDSALRRVWWRDLELHLSAMQFDLLAYLAARPGVMVSIETLRREVWREGWGDTNKVTKMIGRIRSALGPDARAYIASSRGYYMYEPK